VAAGPGPESIAIDPTGRFVRGRPGHESHVTSTRIDPVTAELTRDSSGTVGHEHQPTSIATVDPLGRNLYVVSKGADAVSVYVIDGSTGLGERGQHGDHPPCARLHHD
jgi:6-phosphogluconolactonase